MFTSVRSPLFAGAAAAFFRSKSFFLPTASRIASISSSEERTNQKVVDLSLCLVTNRKGLSDEEFCQRVINAIEGGVTAVQFWDRNEELHASIRTARHLKKFMEERGVTLIINNRVDVAYAAKADGVHLGPQDFPYKEARAILGAKSVIGLSVNSLEEVEEANKADVDYIGLQVLKSNNTKPNHTALWGVGGVKQVRRLTSKRIVAIGGINEKTLEEIAFQLHLGPEGDGIAMAGELWRGDSKEVARKMRRILLESARFNAEVGFY